MARRPKGSPPSYCLHKQSGQACFNWPLGGGKYKVILLGKHGSEESHKEYERVLAEWRVSNGAPPNSEEGRASDLTVAELLLRFWKHASERYVGVDGTPTSEQDHYRHALKSVLCLYGPNPAKEFGPLALKAVRQKMLDAREFQVRRTDREGAPARWVGEDKVKQGEGKALLEKKWAPVEVLGTRQTLSRKVINQRIDHVRRVFKWAVAEELVPSAVYQSLQAVDGLRRGQKGTRDKAKIKPVADEVVEATLRHLRPTVAAMVQVQRLTGARPSEMCNMRVRHIDRTGPVWWHRIDPNDGSGEQHKTAHHEDGSGNATVKQLPIGPRAQAILAPFLEGREPDAFVFSPAECRKAHEAEKRSKRKTKVQPSQLCRKKARPKRVPREHYNRHSYAHAIARAAKKAGVAHWHPHQLKHAIATEVRRRHGAEAAQVYVGHANLSTTEIYAEKDIAQVERIALELG